MLVYPSRTKSGPSMHFDSSFILCECAAWLAYQFAGGNARAATLDNTSQISCEIIPATTDSDMSLISSLSLCLSAPSLFPAGPSVALAFACYTWLSLFEKSVSSPVARFLFVTRFNCRRRGGSALKRGGRPLVVSHFKKNAKFFQKLFSVPHLPCSLVCCCSKNVECNQTSR